MENSKVILLNGKMLLANARGLSEKIPEEMYVLAAYMSEILEEDITIRKLICTLYLVSEDIKKGNGDIKKYLQKNQNAKTMRLLILESLDYFPLIIDEIASGEFASRFRELFEPIFGVAIPPISKW